MAHSKPTKYAQKACCVDYCTLVAKIWTLAVKFWTLSGKHWTVRPRITYKSPKVKNATCHQIKNSGATL